ncbi:MAG: TolC family protein [Candidatus Melainabacteria bacterium]
MLMTFGDEITLTDPQPADGVILLDDLLRQVRQHHPKILSADLERRIAGAKLLEKQGAFDPGIALDSDYLRYNDFTNRGKLSKAWDNDLSMNWLTRSGLKFSLGGRYNTGDVKPPLYPTGQSGEYFMGIRMPLLRGFRVNDKVAAEMQAELGIPLADAAFNETRLAMLLQTAYTYWEWIAAGQKQAIAQDVLTLSETRFNAIQQRVAQGDLPVIDATEAEQEMQRRQSARIKAVREFEKWSYQLSRYRWEPNGTPSPALQSDNAPRNIAEPEAISDEDWMAGRQNALEERPEIKSLGLQKEIVDVDLRFAKNQRLPITDLFATPGYDTGGQSVGLTLKAGVSLVVPLRQRTANGLIRAAEYKIQKLDLDQRLLLQQVLLEVDDAVSAVNAAYQQYLAAKQELKLAREMEAGERTRFEYGDSNLFLVNQRERMTAETFSKVVDIQTEYYQAVSLFNAVTGRLLRNAPGR